MSDDSEQRTFIEVMSPKMGHPQLKRKFGSQSLLQTTQDYLPLDWGSVPVLQVESDK